ncbi:hypothetical protein F2P79_006286 [Pimephales promelas]|nr:hypothetical protein F2P79_006286 [Pimephales promelas]
MACSIVSFSEGERRKRYLKAKVKRFCQACPTSQVTSPRTPPPTPLISLPIIEVLFKRIGMPLPKSARGHEHILVIIDNATRYPEAVPLRKATAKASSPEIGQTTVLQHDIRTPPGVIVRQRPYRVPEACWQAIEEEVQKM